MRNKLSTTELRKRNRNLVFQYFYDTKQAKTKQDIAVHLGLSLPTVTQNLRDLMQAGVIDYVGVEHSTGGRRARTMALVADARFSIGIELSTKNIRLIAVNLCAEELAFQSIAAGFSSDDGYWKQLAQTLEDFMDAFGLERTKLLGVGITLPGIIDETRGIITSAPILHLREMKLSLLTERIPYPVYIENDASAGGYAEWWHQNDLGSMAYVFVGKGVGGALLMDGKPYAGVHRRSAEFGHMSIVPEGTRCSCGKQGCLEAYCSTARLSDDLGISIEDFFQAIKDGNPAYLALWQQYLQHLSIGINTIHMILDCDVVLGGILTPYLPEYLPDIRARLQSLDSFGSSGDFLRLGKCHAKGNCIGVALHFIDQFVSRL